MPTNTPAILPPARQDPRQVANYLDKLVNWNDPDVANGVPFENSLPKNAVLLLVLVEIIVAFDGAAPALSVGTVGAAYNNIVAAGDINEAATGVAVVTRGLGAALTAAAAVTPYVKLGLTTPSTGQARITLVFTGGDFGNP